ncbi:MAG: hypothetical protein P8X62_11835 [Flavobacteriaceae bacterium]
MRFGTLVYEPKKSKGFDFHVLRVKQETGKRIPPSKGMLSNIAVFADTSTARSNCTCPRCKNLWKKSGLSWLEWRRTEVTEYMSQIRERVKNDLIMCIQPDPITSYERYGVDFDDFSKIADAFNVVMLSKSYATPWYWEMLARGFKKILKKPVYITLYVSCPGDKPEDVPPSAELLTTSVRCARTGIDGILYFAAGVDNLLKFQKGMIDNFEFRDRLKNYGKKPVQEVLELVSNWEKSF